jgi:phosphoglucosamine mutase
MNSPKATLRYFGTDGIRDHVEGPLLDPRFVYRLGQAVARWMGPASSGSRHVVVGRDTRQSASILFLALAKGFAAEGVRVFNAGTCPTPAIARAVLDLDLDMGIMITASHNPASDNGIKLFSSAGHKLTTEEELAIEAIIDQIPLPDVKAVDTATHALPGGTPAVMQYEGRRHYLRVLERLLPEKALLGLRVVLDTANGATVRTSGELLTRMGAQVMPYGANPNGENINDRVGSEFPELICRATTELKADIGIAHDGDGDRVILCDNTGNLVDGDAILALLGTAWAGRNELAGNGLVATIMSNLGLEAALRSTGTAVIRTDVGDRNVFFEMQRRGFVLGGEASGHFIAMEHLPTGDGLLAALLVLKEMLASGKTLAELAAVFQPFPQLKKNLPVTAKPPLASIEGLLPALEKLNGDLGPDGRVLLRYSGTEAKIRLLAEAATEASATDAMARLRELVDSTIPLA